MCWRRTERAAPADAADRGQGHPAAGLARCGIYRGAPAGPGGPGRRVPDFFASVASRRKGPKAGWPRFRSREDRRQAIRFTAGARFKVLTSGKLRLPKIGDVPVRWSRPPPSEPSWVAGRSWQHRRAGRAARRTLAFSPVNRPTAQACRLSRRPASTGPPGLGRRGRRSPGWMQSTGSPSSMMGEPACSAARLACRARARGGLSCGASRRASRRCATSPLSACGRSHGCAARSSGRSALSRWLRSARAAPGR